MTYKLAFNESALKEWKKLEPYYCREQFKKKLRERMENPGFRHLSCMDMGPV